VTDHKGEVLSSGACIGMPPAVGCPVTYRDDLRPATGTDRAADLSTESAIWSHGRPGVNLTSCDQSSSWLVHAEPPICVALTSSALIHLGAQIWPIGHAWRVNGPG
jgi:hypothetical protein